MIFEKTSPTQIKVKGITQTTFNKKIKNLQIQKKTVHVAETNTSTGWSS